VGLHNPLDDRDSQPITARLGSEEPRSQLCQHLGWNRKATVMNANADMVRLLSSIIALGDGVARFHRLAGSANQVDKDLLELVGIAFNPGFWQRGF